MSLSPCHPVQASRLFGRIRQTVACQAAPATLKSAFLEPLSTQLATELSVEMFGRADEDFMSLFTGERRVHRHWGDVLWTSSRQAGELLCCAPWLPNMWPPTLPYRPV